MLYSEWFRNKAIWGKAGHLADHAAMGIGPNVVTTTTLLWAVNPATAFSVSDISIQQTKELVANSDMSLGTINWDAVYQSTISAVSGKLRVTAFSGTNPYGRQLITVVPGKTYLVQAGSIYSPTTNGTWRFLVGNTTSVYSDEYGIFLGGSTTWKLIKATTSVMNIAISGGNVLKNQPVCP